MLCFKSHLFLNKKESNIFPFTYAKQALGLQCTPFSGDKLWQVGLAVKQICWLLLRAANKAIEAEMLFTSYIQKQCAMAVQLSGNFCQSQVVFKCSVACVPIGPSRITHSQGKLEARVHCNKTTQSGCGNVITLPSICRQEKSWLDTTLLVVVVKIHGKIHMGD